MSGHYFKNMYILRSALVFIGVMQVIFSIIIIAVAAMNVEQGLKNDDASFLTFASSLCYLLEFWVVGFATGDMYQKDERPAWVAFSASTPSSARGQVLSKYYVMITIYIIIATCCVITDMIVGLITKGEVSASMVIIMIFSLMMLIQAVETPFYFRFGMDKGIAIKGGALGVFLLLFVTYVLFGDISFMIDTDDPMAAITEWLNGDGPIMILALLPFAAAAAYFVSYKISLKIYRKGAEDYGQ